MNRAYVVRVYQQIRPSLFTIKQLVDFIINEQRLHNDESCKHVTNGAMGTTHQQLWSWLEGSIRIRGKYRSA
jgi:hypothetical protein